MTEIFEAIEEGDADRLRELVEREPALASARDPNGLSAVLAARYRWRQDLVDVLLAAGPELDVFDAAAVSDAERVRELLEADPELVNAWAPDGFTPLQLASYFGQLETVRLLLERGADVGAVARNTMAVMPLHAACATGQLGIAELLLDHGADVNARQHGGYTPLHEAAGNGDAELARLLLDRGADKTIRLEGGQTPRALAADRGHPELAELLG